MEKVLLYYDPVFLTHECVDHHPENPGRLTAIIDELRNEPFFPQLDLRTPNRASRAAVTAVHDAAYVDRLAQASPGFLDQDTYFSSGSLEAAYKAAGALTDAVDAVIKEKIRRVFCAVRPPGHHAERGRQMGFCLFNNAAIGAKYARAQGFSRVFVIDFDVHHGNGIQHSFEEDPTVFYFSTHQYPFYPGTGSPDERGYGEGAGYTRNYPLAMGAGDKELSAVYVDRLPGYLKDFDPDLVIVSAGYDIHESDPLAYVNASTEGIRAIVRSILDAAGPVPCIFTLEGGYDYRALAEGVAATVEELIAD